MAATGARSLSDLSSCNGLESTSASSSSTGRRVKKPESTWPCPADALGQIGRGKPRLCCVLVSVFVFTVAVLLGSMFLLWFIGEGRARQGLETTAFGALDDYSLASNEAIDELVKNLARRDAKILEWQVEEFLDLPRTAVEMLEHAMGDLQGLVTSRGLDNNAKYLWGLQHIDPGQDRHQLLGARKSPKLDNIYYADHMGMYMAYTNLCVSAASPRCGLDWSYGFDLRLRDDHNSTQMVCGDMCPPLDELHSGNVSFFLVEDASGKPTVKFGEQKYDPRTRPWYQRAVDSVGLTTWTNVYEDELNADGSHPDMGFTVSKAHFKRGEVSKVAASTITLAKMTEIVTFHQPQSQGCHLFIVDSQGLMIASSLGRSAVICEEPSCTSRQFYANESKHELVQTAMEVVSTLFTQDLSKIVDVGAHLHEDGNIYSYAPLRSGASAPSLAWTAIHVQPVAHYKAKVIKQLNLKKASILRRKQQMDHDLREARVKTVEWGVAMMFVGAVAIGCISWQVTRPLKYIARDMHSVAKLELDNIDNLLENAEHGRLSSMIYEVSQIRDSFADMTNGLRSFSRYMDPYVVQLLLQSQQQAQLGVKRADVTIFFSDIANFTSIAESVQPPVFLDMLEEYLDRTSNIIMAHKGVVGEFVGDGIMAWWNVPLDLGEFHTTEALAAALEQQRAVSELRPIWDSRGLPEVHVRMGLVRGQVFAGNIGSRNRMKYGLVGDSVNLASRLESLCKKYCVQILIDGDTGDAPGVRDDFFLRPIDLVVVKGRTSATELLEVVARKSSVRGTALQDMYEKFCVDFCEIHRLYRNREPRAALGKLQEYLVLWPSDRPSHIIKERCEALLDSDLGEHWSPVEKLTEK